MMNKLTSMILSLPWFLAILAHGEVLDFREESLINTTDWDNYCHRIDWAIVQAYDNSKWRIFCATDFTDQNIDAFHAADLTTCANSSLAWNLKNNQPPCLAYVYDPSYDFIGGNGPVTNCYLKGGANHIKRQQHVPLLAAALLTTAFDLSQPPSLTFPVQTASATKLARSTDVADMANEFAFRSARPKLESLDEQQVLLVVKSSYIGESEDKPASQYVQHAQSQPLKLSASLLQPGINPSLVTDFELAGDTGTWTSDSAEGKSLSEISLTPRTARDGGRGGNINGTNVFFFCDTSTYGDHETVFGYLNGFVSSSVAVDESMNGLRGEALQLTDTLGQWQDDVGRIRGFAPMTEGEEAFNSALSGKGYRYAVWPNSSPTSLNATHALVYAPLVYLEVDMDTQTNAKFTSLGNTLLLIHVDEQFGPHAERLNNQFFTGNEVLWGSLGGIRAWSSSGAGTNDGTIYLFGQSGGEPIGGVLMAKVDAKTFDDRSSYQYWDGNGWTSNMPPLSSTSNAYILSGNIMEMDLIYSPLHKTFIVIYLTQSADNTFYYRYLTSRSGRPLNILSSDMPGGDRDFVEQLISADSIWSEERTLFTVPEPARGYAYAGGLHAGYFGDVDITNGGTKMLCTWTEHTAADPNVPNSGYAHKAQIIELDWQ